MEYDAVDRILDQWAERRPDLDASPMGIVGRLHRVGALLDAELRGPFAEAGLGNGDFDVLASLRRAGQPLTPTQLMAEMMVTSGAVTKRVDRLAERGLVQRSESADDARSRLVALTSAGRRLVDRLVVRHVENEERLLEPLDRGEREQLAGLLRRLLVHLEGEVPPPRRSTD